MIEYEVCASGGLHFPIPYRYCLGEYVDIPDNKIDDPLIGGVRKIRGDAGSITSKRTHVRGANEGVVLEKGSGLTLNSTPRSIFADIREGVGGKYRAVTLDLTLEVK